MHIYIYAYVYIYINIYIHICTSHYHNSLCKLFFSKETSDTKKLYLSRHSTEGVLSSKNIHISQTLSSKFSLGIAKLSFQIVQLNLRIA